MVPGGLQFFGGLQIFRGVSKFFFSFFFLFFQFLFPPKKSSGMDPPKTVNARPVCILLECILVSYADRCQVRPLQFSLQNPQAVKNCL